MADFWGTEWTRTLEWGMKGPDVQCVHNNLYSLFRENWMDKYPVPSYSEKLYSLNTKKAVEHFQRRIDIPVTGKVDKYTWEYINWALDCYDAYYLSQANAK